MEYSTTSRITLGLQARYDILPATKVAVQTQQAISHSVGRGMKPERLCPYLRQGDHITGETYNMLVWKQHRSARPAVLAKEIPPRVDPNLPIGLGKF